MLYTEAAIMVIISEATAGANVSQIRIRTNGCMPEEANTKTVLH